MSYTEQNASLDQVSVLRNHMGQSHPWLHKAKKLGYEYKISWTECNGTLPLERELGRKLNTAN